MEEDGSSCRKKRKDYEDEEEEENQSYGMSQILMKKPKLPGLASVIIEAMKLDSLQRLTSLLEPLLRRIVSEEVDRALTKQLEQHKQLIISNSNNNKNRSGEESKTLQLQFKTKMPPHLFTGGKVEGEQGSSIHVILIDPLTGSIVRTGPESCAKLSIVVLGGDFNEESDESWTKQVFESYEVKEREGKGPLLSGELMVNLKEGIGTVGDLSFTDNSSWVKSRKFRLGVKTCYFEEGFRILEGKTDPFAVKDHRGELYKKHYPPALNDEVWRLDRIAKDGALHKKLIKSQIITVEDFLRVLVRDGQKLRTILGSGMSNRMWENTVEHAKTCVLGNKLYVYYADGARGIGVAFNDVYELTGLIAEEQFFQLDSLTFDQKILVDSLVKKAYENWNRVVEYDNKILNSLAIGGNYHQKYQQQNELSDSGSASNVDYASTGFEDFASEEEIRIRSLEMLERDDMQIMLKTLNTNVYDQTFYSYSNNEKEELKIDGYGDKERGHGGKKAVVSWVKLKAALRWGIFVRKKAAERRAQLVELDS
ncbi:calmodulin-binding protein 60 F-like [Impatiens glandulifera]|uniref:calmodulin-binding protein 60 F-like n=1 Tax=Impatiens glandulifera TaxID=253017 RepID=UPI001FB1540F|nr:calmodulin-binding protein 60 F-like [Impatiens glandulifera]